MVGKIVSGGQTGVDRAALDMALERNIPCGGWCPKGRLAEDGPLDPRYLLAETPTPNYFERTEWNVRDSDATLIVTRGKMTEGTTNTLEYAKKWKKPCFVVDLAQKLDPQEVRDWIEKEKIGVLNVAGPRESKCPGIYSQSRMFLWEVLNLP